ncbi:MAG TPA: Fic family protein [Acidimicrobiales bacterium]|nr:Fic family protein [Acidimicrobiales bacterium]
MSRVVSCRWEAELESGLSRRDRQTCEYEAYVPDLLVGRRITFDGDVAADVADAEAAIARLNTGATTLVDTEALARLLLRAESVASSKIEGLEVGPRRLIRAEAARILGDTSGDVTADEVLGNIEAMSWGVETLAQQGVITLDGLLEVHRRLLAGTRLAEHGGKIRTQQNWIGGSGYNPCSAAFVPPPYEEVHALLEDLCAFCNEDSLPAVAQAAIAHAQFETIHPFIDGNGRIGRALIHVVLRRRGLAEHVLPPISLILATQADDYVAGLTATRYRGEADTPAAYEGLNQWIARFASAASRSVADAGAFEARVSEIQDAWRTRVGRIRTDSATDRLIRALPGAPIVTVNGAGDFIGRSFQQTNEAIARLVEAGVLSQVSIGRRNRAFEAAEIVDAFMDLERQLASPQGDTRSSPPVRVVPRRR